MTTKTDVLKKIYFDRSGFGSMQTTYKDAKEKDNSITMNDVKDFFEECRLALSVKSILTKQGSSSIHWIQ